MKTGTGLADDAEVIERVLEHVDHRTTDLATVGWREPIDNYRRPERFDAELRMLRQRPVGFCPSAALTDAGSFVTREAAGTPVVAVRDKEGTVRGFINSCSHRGAAVANEPTGCAKALVCPYHGWTFGLDGDLRGVPHGHGFPDLDRSTSGLIPLWTREHGGVVFVSQSDPTAEMVNEIDALPDLIPDKFRFVKVTESVAPTNWKISVEGFLEGYHIRSTHSDTFYPIQYDNVNVIEHFGRNSRVTFPYRNIEALRDTPAADRHADGYLTYAYQLFPNVIVATQPGRMSLIVLEPRSIDATASIAYTLSDHFDGTENAEATLAKEESFAAKGARQDRAVQASVQRALHANSRDAFQFGLFEGAIGHFHRHLADVLGADCG